MPEPEPRKQSDGAMDSAGDLGEAVGEASEGPNTVLRSPSQADNDLLASSLVGLGLAGGAGGGGSLGDGRPVLAVDLALSKTDVAEMST